MSWNLYQDNQLLKPLCFSNGKTQEDVVKEVISEIKGGTRVIFIHGVCGTGKSAIALNIARELGRASIVVPGKNLQNQYKIDYEDNKYLLKDNKEKLKISVITGRNNHACKFIEDNNIIPKIKKEVNTNLNDIFSSRFVNKKASDKENSSADNSQIPCKIEIREKNFSKLKEYIKQNSNADPRNYNKASEVKRISVASACPYWSPCLPEKYDISRIVGEHEKRTYMGLDGVRFVFYKRKAGCKFYGQFDKYIDSDVIVFNSLKYKLETAINRKPETEVEIVDECDEFLDSFSSQRTINLDRLQNSLAYIFTEEERVFTITAEINELIKELKVNKDLEAAAMTNTILPLRNTLINEIIKILLKNQDILGEIDDESYVFDVIETAKIFEEFLDETYLVVNKKENSFSVNLVTTNLAKMFKEIVDKNKIIILMSGTLHSERVLKEIFGLENFKIIDAETSQQGQIEIVRMGDEKDCKYSNFTNGTITRREYLEYLDKCVEVSKKPTLVHVNAFTDLPNEFEKEKYELHNLMTSEKLKEIQDLDKEGNQMEIFKKGQIEVLFSTKCSRGIDFPGEQCKSIVFTKYPNPNVQDPFWKILNQTNPQHYWDFYKDKAKRELWQKVYRGLRFKEDHVYVLSPDTRVLEVFEEFNKTN